MGAPKPFMPLFQVQLTLGEDRKPRFSTEPKVVVFTVTEIFDQGLKSLQEISQIEQKLLPHLFKTNVKMFLKATVRPASRPEEPDPTNKKLLPDENAWVFEEYYDLREKILHCVEPMEKYLRTFDIYEKEYQLDPDAIIKTLDDPDNPPDISDLKKEVIFRQKEATRLSDEIPDNITVSMFKIDCKDIKDTLAQKHIQIAEAVTKLIANRAKANANEIISSFEQMNMKMETTPKDIEELSAIREYMAGVPKDIEKLQTEIDNCMNIYKILDEFQYTFKEEEDYDRKWKVFGSPVETYSKINKTNNQLEKEKEKFLQLMVGNQGEFQNTTKEIDTLVSSFNQYKDAANYEEVAVTARNIQTKLE